MKFCQDAGERPAQSGSSLDKKVRNKREEEEGVVDK